MFVLSIRRSPRSTCTDTLFPYTTLCRSPVTKIEDGKTKVLPQPSADPAADAPAAVRNRQQVLAETPRVAIDTPALSGSINLKGPRIDDLILKDYNQTVAKDSAPIRLQIGRASCRKRGCK